MASRLGLEPGTAVAAAIIDAHSAVPAATVVEAARMVLVIGTSTCHMLLADRHAPVEGIGGVVEDGIVEGFYGYEAGQPAVGDLFGWFAQLAGGGDFAALEREAAAVPPGARGLLALDWWNGNRSVLVDANLSGLLVGLTLSTTAAEIYRALIEATAFSTRRILDAFEAGSGSPCTSSSRWRASPSAARCSSRSTPTSRGGRSRSRRRANASALGAAMLGAVAAGLGARRPRLVRRRGARDGVAERDAFRAEAREPRSRRTPCTPSTARHDLFGRGGDDVMRRLRRLRG